MEDHTIFVTEHDMERLRKLLDDERRGKPRTPDHLKDLAEEVERSQVVAAKAVPADVITMNSRVRLVDLDTGEEMDYTLVFPEDADVAEGRISVLAPIGTGMLGYRVGDVFEWPVPGGLLRLRVDKILYQPEKELSRKPRP